VHTRLYDVSVTTLFAFTFFCVSFLYYTVAFVFWLFLFDSANVVFIQDTLSTAVSPHSRVQPLTHSTAVCFHSRVQPLTHSTAVTFHSLTRSRMRAETTREALTLTERSPRPTTTTTSLGRSALS
jgi:hypothetical protein